jgi:hypothetical protein
MVATMSTPHIEIDSETSRIRAALVNSGQYTFDEAEQRLAASRLSIILGGSAAGTAAGQAAFLTAVVTGVRCFGEVTVLGALDDLLVVPLPLDVKSLAEAAAALGARQTDRPLPNRKVIIGSGIEPGEGWSVQAWWDGWTAGVAPGNNPVAIGRGDCVLAGIAAGALAVGQAFLGEQGDLRAGRTVQGLSLWWPDLGEHAPCQPDPRQLYLPTSLWFVGLGNLGQAYLWSLILLPYPVPEDVLLYFQDDQTIKKENWGTSVLVKRGHYGLTKTRLAEDWALARKFQVRRIDRRLDARLHRAAYEPGIAIAGLDTMEARRLLGHRGFDYVIDAGLGATSSEYRKFRINVFGAADNPIDHFRGVEDPVSKVAQELLKLPAYRELSATGDDGRCGAATLAETSVAVPFVSAFVGALAISQAMRIASGEAHHLVLTGDTGDLRTVRGSLGEPPQRLIVGNALAPEMAG